MVPTRLLLLSITLVTRLVTTVTPYQVLTLPTSQLVWFVQCAPLVELYKSTSASESEFRIGVSRANDPAATSFFELPSSNCGIEGSPGRWSFKNRAAIGCFGFPCAVFRKQKVLKKITSANKVA